MPSSRVGAKFKSNWKQSPLNVWLMPQH